MKSASSGLNTHLQGEVTTLATCWQVTRSDRQVFRFTDHDVDLPVDIADGNGAHTYLASSSYNRSAIKNDDTLSVDNLDLTGVLDSSAIDETELRRGLFDFAEVMIFVVNYKDLAQGILRMRKGWLGEVTVTPNGFFLAELRGLTQAFSRKIGELYSPECRADLGDSRCKVPILPAVVRRLMAYAVGDFVRASPAMDGLAAATLLVHADTNANDLSPNAAVAIVGSQAAVQTVQKVFGAGSIEFTPSGSQNPSNAFVSFPDIAAYTIGTQQFTIEGRLRFKSLAQSRQIFASHYTNTGNQRAWYISRNGANMEFAYSLNGTTLSTIVRAATWAINTDYHLAVTRDAAGNIRLFQDGVQLGAAVTDAGSIFNSTSPLWLGKFRSATFTDDPVNGFIDEFRFIVGTAAYTTSFTPPAVAFQSLDEVAASLFAPDFSDRIYRCTIAGTTAVSQPSYDITLGNPTVDGTATFVSEQAWSRAITVATVDGAKPRKTFTVSQLTPPTGGVTPGRDFFPDDSMNGGVVVWETGPNAGKAMEVRDFIASSQTLELFLDLPFDMTVGDTGRVYRGCFKRALSDCRDVFNNIVNFRGEPHVPGQDLLFNYPDAKS